MDSDELKEMRGKWSVVYKKLMVEESLVKFDNVLDGVHR
jgi:hypothetical protein